LRRIQPMYSRCTRIYCDIIKSVRRRSIKIVLCRR
jgi:hypothetical protein